MSYNSKPLSQSTGRNAIRATKKFTPVGDKVVIQVIRVTETEGGIALPESSQDRYSTPAGWVIAVGPEVKQVKEGDKVLAPASLPCLSIRHDGDELVIVHEKDLVGVVLT